VSGVRVPPPLPFKSFIPLFLKDNMAFPENRNHIRSHTLSGLEWAAMLLFGIVSRPHRRCRSASLSAPRPNPDGASNWLLRGRGRLPASVNGITIVALYVMGRTSPRTHASSDRTGGGWFKRRDWLNSQMMIAPFCSARSSPSPQSCKVMNENKRSLFGGGGDSGRLLTTLPQINLLAKLINFK
jgi:hypothetical protein